MSSTAMTSSKFERAKAFVTANMTASELKRFVSRMPAEGVAAYFIKKAKKLRKQKLDNLDEASDEEDMRAALSYYFNKDVYDEEDVWEVAEGLRTKLQAVALSSDDEA